MAEEEKTQIEEIEQAKKAEKTQIEEIEQTETVVAEEKKPKKERTAILYIQTTKNNTILTLTDMAGHALSRSSGGQNTKQARLKSSPTIAMFAAKKISEEAKELGITNLYVRIKAQTGESSPSSASHAIIKSLSRDDFKIISILDTTKNPRGGPKKAGGRRGRRV
jgi:small subunit ribosomal protein S11